MRKLLFAVGLTEVLLVGKASGAETLRLSADRLPEVVAQTTTSHGLIAHLRFPGVAGDAIATHPRAVVTVLPGRAVPSELRVQGRRLGANSPHWVVPARRGEHGLDAARRWMVHEFVAYAMPDLMLHPVRTDVEFDDPRHGGQWYMDLLKMDTLFAVSLGRSETRIAVIDSAIEVGHPDLAAGVIAPLDAFGGDEDPSPNPGEFCPGSGSTALCDSHGTSVAGIVAARANNGVGIVGFCPECSLIPIKMLGDGSGSLSADIQAFEHAIDNNASVVNNSWGFNVSRPVPTALAEVIHRAATLPRNGLGAVVVFAAGNDNRVINDNELQALDDVLCVSATDRYGMPTAYTNSGKTVDLAAPSATFTTTIQSGYTDTFGGTSAAAPVAAGIAAWILSVAPSLSAKDVRALMVKTAVPSPKVTHDAEGHHPVYGYGELSPTRILQELRPNKPDAGLDAAADGSPDDAADAMIELDAGRLDANAADASPMSQGGSEASDDGGCGCRVGRQQAPQGFSLWGLVSLAALLLGRKQTPRK